MFDRRRNSSFTAGFTAVNSDWVGRWYAGAVLERAKLLWEMDRPHRALGELQRAMRRFEQSAAQVSIGLWCSLHPPAPWGSQEEELYEAFEIQPSCGVLAIVITFMVMIYIQPTLRSH